MMFLVGVSKHMNQNLNLHILYLNTCDSSFCCVLYFFTGNEGLILTIFTVTAVVLDASSLFMFSYDLKPPVPVFTNILLSCSIYNVGICLLNQLI